MAAYLLKKATDDLTIETEKGLKIKGRELTTFLERLIELNAVFAKVDRHLRDSRVLDLLLTEGADTKAFLADKAKVDALAMTIQSFGYSTDVSTDEEHSVQKLVYREGSQTPRTISYQLLSSAEYHRLIALHRAIGEMDQPPFIATTEAGSTKLASRQELVSHLMEVGKKDLQITRYKGLGEMNPDQLWETTMDPDKRNLLQVQINDKVSTDNIFTILMGDAVEPRRQFIEDNALEVKNLDI
jgi:DNA gyrase subunit B